MLRRGIYSSMALLLLLIVSCSKETSFEKNPSVLEYDSTVYGSGNDNIIFEVPQKDTTLVSITVKLWASVWTNLDSVGRNEYYNWPGINRAPIFNGGYFKAPLHNKLLIQDTLIDMTQWRGTGKMYLFVLNTTYYYGNGDIGPDTTRLQVIYHTK